MQKWNEIRRNLEKKYGKTRSLVLFAFIKEITTSHRTIKKPHANEFIIKGDFLRAALVVRISF